MMVERASYRTLVYASDSANASVTRTIVQPILQSSCEWLQIPACCADIGFVCWLFLREQTETIRISECGPRTKFRHSAVWPERGRVHDLEQIVRDPAGMVTHGFVASLSLVECLGALRDAQLRARTAKAAHWSVTRGERAFVHRPEESKLHLRHSLMHCTTRAAERQICRELHCRWLLFLFKPGQICRRVRCASCLPLTACIENI